MNHKKITLSPDTLYKTFKFISDTKTEVCSGYKTNNPPFNSYVNDESVNTGDRTLKFYLMKMTTPYMADNPVFFQIDNMFDDGNKI